MDLRVKAIAPASIRTDGGTQVREAMREDKIGEYAELYSELRALDPIVVCVDENETTWLVDGFHRLEAAKRAGMSTIQARVISGSLDAAKLAAAGANVKSSIERLPGDKTRAILLAMEQWPKVYGKRPTQEQIAKHCGVTQQFVSRVYAGDTTCCTSKSSINKTGAVDDALAADPSRSNAEIAASVGASETLVSKRRSATGAPRAPKRMPPKCDAVEIARLLREGELTQEQIAEQVGVNKRTVHVHAKRLGLGGRATERKTAQERHPHPNDSAERVHSRPPAARAPSADARALVAMYESMPLPVKWEASVLLVHASNGMLQLGPPPVGK